jgi:hypothetical protein
MLWTEPAGQASPGRTRNSTHFSTVLFGEQVYSEIRRFIVVRNKGTFSQCMYVSILHEILFLVEIDPSVALFRPIGAVALPNTAS